MAGIKLFEELSVTPVEVGELELLSRTLVGTRVEEIVVEISDCCLLSGLSNPPSVRVKRMKRHNKCLTLTKVEALILLPPSTAPH